MANKYMKKNAQHLLAIREKQIKTTMRFHLTPVRMAIIKITITNGREDGGEDTLHSYGGNVN
jgi:hypothetical protein